MIMIYICVNIYNKYIYIYIYNIPGDVFFPITSPNHYDYGHI